MALANQEAGRLNHEYIGSEHILLGLLGSQRGTAAKVLGALRITVTGLRDAITAAGPTEVSQHIPMSKRLVEEAIAQARNLHHSEVGTGHLLLAILNIPECNAACRLQKLGHQLLDIRARTLSLVTSREGVQQGECNVADARLEDLEERVRRLEDTIVTAFRENARLRRERGEDR